MVGHTCKAHPETGEVDMTSEAFQKLVYRDGNAFRLQEQHDGMWSFFIGVRVQEADLLEGSILNNVMSAICAVCDGDVDDPLEPGRVYWFFEAWWPEEEVPGVMALAGASGVILTATTGELFQELGNAITVAQKQNLKRKGSRYKLVRPEALTRQLSRPARKLPREAAPPGLVDAEGQPVRPQAVRISAPGGYLASPSDVISTIVGRVIAHPRLLTINPSLRQVDYPFQLRTKKATRENRQGRVVYHPPPDWGEDFTDPILGKLLEEAQNMDREDLFLYSLIMNELPRHGAQGFSLGLETIHKAKGNRGRQLHGGTLAEALVALHQRLHRLARIAVYAPSNIYISGRYFEGAPFQGGGLINVGHPTAYMPTLAGKPIPAEWYIQPGPVGLFLCQEFGINGNRPQFGIYPEAVFRLDLERREGAFRLALPIAQLWRIRAGKAADLDRTWNPRNLFEMAGLSLPGDRRNYQRWLERRQEDLEALVDCGLLHSWQWAPEWVADLANKAGGVRREPGWFNQLLDDSRLILEPHPAILRQYADAGLPEARRYLNTLTARPGVEAPARALPGPTRRPRRRTTG